MGKRIFVSDYGFGEVSANIKGWLIEVGHLDETGRPKRSANKETKPELEAQKPEPKAQEETMSKDNKKNLNDTIRQLHAANMKWREIATQLNKLGFATETGKSWTSGSAAIYGLRYAGVSRRNKARTKAPAPKASPTRKTSKDGITDDEMDMIWTSNLETGLKRKVTRILASFGGL